jgi:nucleoid DNA-binding protein
MNKGDIINKIAQSAGITKAQATAALGATLDGIQESLQSGESVTLIGFGTFGVNHRAERNGKNPKTKQPIVIPARKVVSFKAGKALSESVR